MYLTLNVMKLPKTLIIVVLLIIKFQIDSFASNVIHKMKNINITGLIVDSNTLVPISDANVYDAGNTKLGVTDANGYFSVKLNLPASAGNDFKILIKKAGYDLYTQKEHWGEIGSEIYVTYYFGIQNTNSKAKSFSEFVIGNKNNSYVDVKEGFNNIKKKIDFNIKIEDLKAGNNDLFFKVEENYYLISETGWVKLDSDKSVILINKEKKLPANEINFYVKRNNIKSMTPSDNNEAPFEINTY